MELLRTSLQFLPRTAIVAEGRSYRCVDTSVEQPLLRRRRVAAAACVTFPPSHCTALQLRRPSIDGADGSQATGCQRAGCAGSTSGRRLRPSGGSHVRPGRRLRCSDVCRLAAPRRRSAAVPVPPGQAAAVRAGGRPGGGGAGQRAARGAAAPPGAGAPWHPFVFYCRCFERIVGPRIPLPAR